MENWLYDWNTIKSVSSHYQTNETLPKSIFEQIVKGMDDTITSFVFVVWKEYVSQNVRLFHQCFLCSRSFSLTLLLVCFFLFETDVNEDQYDS